MRPSRAAEQINGDSKSKIKLLYCWYMFGHRMMRRRMSSEHFEKLFEHIKSEHEQEFDQFLTRYKMNRSMPEVAFEFGEPEYTIAPFVKQNAIDITVMSTICPTTTVSRLLGSTIENVISELPSNLLAIKPPGFVSPIQLEEKTGQIIEPEGVEFSMRASFELALNTTLCSSTICINGFKLATQSGTTIALKRVFVIQFRARL